MSKMSVEDEMLKFEDLRGKRRRNRESEKEIKKNLREK